MTDLERELVEKRLYAEMRETRELNGRITPEQQRRYDELSCIRMINSIIAYDWTEGQTAEELLEWELDDKYHSYLADYVDRLGYFDVLALVQAQLDDIEAVERGIFEDGEGLSYNSITWKNKEVM